jgi:hypothetical protein
MPYIYPESVPDGCLREQLKPATIDYNNRNFATPHGFNLEGKSSFPSLHWAEWERVPEKARGPSISHQPSAISYRGSVETMCSKLPTSGLAILRLRSRSFLPHRRNNDAQPVVWMAWAKLVHAPCR